MGLHQKLSAHQRNNYQSQETTERMAENFGIFSTEKGLKPRICNKSPKLNTKRT
jgi:hypothetical protein